MHTPRMTHRCERCPRATELFYSASLDEYLCEECMDLPRCEQCSGFMKAPGIFAEHLGEFICDECAKEPA